MTSATAERNVEVIRDLLETANGGSEALLVRLEELFDPEVEWRGVATGRQSPGGDVVYRGHDGIRRFWGDVEEVFERIRFDNLRLESVGNEVVLALLVVSGTGRQSGLRIVQEMGFIYRLRDGRIVAGEDFASHEGAAAAARRMAEEGHGA